MMRRGNGEVPRPVAERSPQERGEVSEFARGKTLTRRRFVLTAFAGGVGLIGCDALNLRQREQSSRSQPVDWDPIDKIALQRLQAGEPLQPSDIENIGENITAREAMRLPNDASGEAELTRILDSMDTRLFSDGRGGADAKRAAWMRPYVVMVTAALNWERCGLDPAVLAERFKRFERLGVRLPGDQLADGAHRQMVDMATEVQRQLGAWWDTYPRESLLMLDVKTQPE